MRLRFKLPTLTDLIVVGGLMVIAGAIWLLDPKHRVDPYKDEVNS